MKRFSVLLVFALLLATFAACRETESPAPPEEETPLTAETLTVEFAPTGGDPAAQMARLRQTADKLKAALADAGVTVESVGTTLGSSPAATAQAVAQGGVDGAFLPEETLAEFGGSAGALLGAAWIAPSCDSETCAPWNEQETTWTTEWAAGRRVLLLAGPSAYGKNLADRVRGGGTLTWEELSRAKWGLAGGWTADAAGQWLGAQSEGCTLADLPHTAAYESEEELLNALAAETVDLIPILADDRIDAADQWTRSTVAGGYGRGGFIWDETCVVGVTEPVFGKVFALGGDSPWGQPPLSDALTAAISALAEDPDFSALAGAERFAAISAAS